MTDPLLTALGLGVRDARKARNLSQEALAQELGWKRTRIADGETGRRGFGGVDDLEQLCAALGVGLDDLLGPSERGRRAAASLRLGRPTR